MGYEAHLNISQKVFVYRFLYTRVLKWTHEYKNVFVFVNCVYVRVGLTCWYYMLHLKTHTFTVQCTVGKLEGICDMQPSTVVLRYWSTGAVHQ
jgi:hypothetical protein